MTKQVIGVGTVANDGTGDTIRGAMNKINANFADVYTALGDGSNLNLSSGEDGSIFIPNGLTIGETFNITAGGANNQLIFLQVPSDGSLSINAGNSPVYFNGSQEGNTLTVEEGTLVFSDASVQTSAALSITELKTIVALSTDFADFQARIAAL